MKRQKTSLPVIGLHDVKGNVVPLKYAPLIDTGKTYRGESNAKLARRLLRDLRKFGAA